MFGPPSPERKLRRRRKPLSNLPANDASQPAAASTRSATSDNAEPAAKRSRSSHHSNHFVARFHPSHPPVVAATQVRGSNGPAEQSRRRKLRLHDRCATFDERQQRQLILNAHPHVAQAFFGADECPSHSFPFTRIVSDDYPALPYRERRFELKSVVPWGQRRLLLAEMEFLTAHAPLAESSSPSPTVVYVGAAPGAHLSHLARLFPSLAFHLVDPAPFQLPQAAPNVTVHSQLFDDSLALDYCGQGVLLISDVRSADLFHSTVQAVDAAIERDLSDQMRWHELMAPLASMLKWRLPWTEGETDYLDGEVRLPVWGSQSTTEGRLWVRGGAGYRRWKHRTFEQQMYHFNTRQRVQLHKRAEEAEGDDSKQGADERKECQPLHGAEHRDKALSGLDGCYDCTVELLILREYLLANPAQQERLRQRVRKQAREQTGVGTEGGLEERKDAPASTDKPTAVPAASSTFMTESPVGALQRTVAAHASMLDSLIPNAIRQLHLQQPHVYHREGEDGEDAATHGLEADETGRGGSGHSSMETGEAAVVDEAKEEQGATGRAAEDDKAGGGIAGGWEQERDVAEEGCTCLDCLCVVMSDEISAELSEGRTLLTAPLLPAAIGTADFSARMMEKKQTKRHKQRIRRQAKGAIPGLGSL